MGRYEDELRANDLYACVPFPTMWKVVVHATPGDLTEKERLAVYNKASDAFAKDGRWNGYVTMFRELRSGLKIPVGYRWANPKDWFLRREAEGEVEGPFQTKKLILANLRAKSASKTDSPGVYKVGDAVLFTRDRAAAVGLNPEVLP